MKLNTPAPVMTAPTLGQVTPQERIKQLEAELLDSDRSRRIYRSELLRVSFERDRLRAALLACAQELETWPKSLALKHGSLGQARAALEGE
jgi:hypothetical protein